MAKIPPRPTPETRQFWQGGREGRLFLQRCTDCVHVYFPPRPFCPKCGSRAVETFAASGHARLYSYVINHRPRADWPQEPHSIAIVDLEEGPRILSNIVGTPQTPEALQLDMPLVLEFEKLSDAVYLPVFRPADTPSRSGTR